MDYQQEGYTVPQALRIIAAKIGAVRLPVSEDAARGQLSEAVGEILAVAQAIEQAAGQAAETEEAEADVPH